MSLRILLADDHGVLRAGLRALLNAEEDLEVIGEAADGAQVLRLARQLKPDLVLMDISMPGTDGLEATRQLQAELPEVRVLLLTVHEDDGLLQEAIRSGASGYILKRAAESELINAIHVVDRGDIYVHPSMTRALFEEQHKNMPINTVEATLTLREIEVLKLIAQGHTNRQVGEILHLSMRTVESHRANLMAKLNLTSRVELVRYALKHGLLDAGGADQV
jgi:two-component system response regulator NreC